MDSNARKNGHNLERLTISGGNRVEPRLMMAHRTRWQWVKDLLLWRASPAHNNPPIWELLLAAILVIVALLAIAYAGHGSAR
jgi:hypothetical protein